MDGVPEALALRGEYYDAVLLSYVLSNLPRARQRTRLVARARRALRRPSAADPHAAGLLIIVQAKSLSKPARPNWAPGAHAPSDSILSTWLEAVESVGFRFVGYDELGGSSRALVFQTVPGDDGPESEAGAADDEAILPPMPLRRELPGLAAGLARAAKTCTWNDPLADVRDLLEAWESPELTAPSP